MAKKQETEKSENVLVHLPVLAGGSAKPPNNADGFTDELTHPPEQPNALAIVTIDHGQEQFLMPSGELVDAITGYPVLKFQSRRYYEKTYQDGDSSPPDCWSTDPLMYAPDASVPLGKKQAVTCEECPHSKFGSGRDGKSQACAVQTWVLILNPAYGTPPIVAVVFPPSSIKVLLGGKFKANGYFTQATEKAGAFQLAWTEFRLERASKTHCIVAPRLLGVCTDLAEKKALAALINHFQKPMEDARGNSANAKVDDADEGGDA